MKPTKIKQPLHPRGTDEQRREGFVEEGGGQEGVHEETVQEHAVAISQANVRFHFKAVLDPLMTWVVVGVI